MPVLYKYEKPLMGIWKIGESWQEMFEALVNKEVYCSGLNRIQSDSRKQEWLAVRLLLQHLAGSETHIRYRENGAPFLSGSVYNISISHTKGFAAIILSENPNPGIDMEYHSVRAWKLRKKYMNGNELDMMTSLCDSEKPDSNEANGAARKMATLCWCAKETAFKALGETDVDFAGHLHIEPFHFSKEGFLTLKENRTEENRRFRINYQVTEDYILTWKE
ncbi:MAG: 4'-phosphopantetheinyl transferase superfamily protein [Tannerella sp.]|nr:4'-phosphopantetheinyl transferase superfamily protein [Tannerella sp.]